MWTDILTHPDAHTRIVALYDDGSGAHLFYFDGHQFHDEDGAVRDGLENSFSMWAYAPEGTRLWCELCDDPVDFHQQSDDRTDASPPSTSA
jgi:hypothetical protein